MHNIQPDLLPLARPLSFLRLDARNAKLHTAAQISEIAKSLSEFGQDIPIVADTNGVIAKGNGRLMAMQLLGWDQAAVVVVDDDRATRIRRAIADNRTADMTDVDVELLMELLGETGGGVPGFTPDYLAELEQLMEQTAPKKQGPLPDGELRPRDKIVKDRAIQVKVVLHVAQVEIVEHALRATGEANRADAMVAICKSFLDYKEASDAQPGPGAKKRQHHIVAESDLEAALLAAAAG